jgi:hypothetical protein
MDDTPFIRKKPTGCSGKCPCPGKWINCGYYIDKQTQEWRLKHKQIELEILEYYQQHFSGVWCIHDLYANG